MSESQYFVALGGICVPESGVRWLTYRLDQIASQYGAPQSVDLHAAEKFQGKKPSRNIGTESHSEKGLIILDKSFYETGLQSLTLDIRQNSNRWVQQTQNIIEVPLFTDLAASRITQLADRVAYAVFRMYRANDLTYFNGIQNRFYERDGVIHGLVHRQTLN